MEIKTEINNIETSSSELIKAYKAIYEKLKAISELVSTIDHYAVSKLNRLLEIYEQKLNNISTGYNECIEIISSYIDMSNNNYQELNESIKSTTNDLIKNRTAINDKD